MREKKSPFPVKELTRGYQQRISRDEIAGPGPFTPEGGRGKSGRATQRRKGSSPALERREISLFESAHCADEEEKSTKPRAGKQPKTQARLPSGTKKGNIGRADASRKRRKLLNLKDRDVLLHSARKKRGGRGCLTHTRTNLNTRPKKRSLSRPAAEARAPRCDQERAYLTRTAPKRKPDPPDREPSSSSEKSVPLTS